MAGPTRIGFLIPTGRPGCEACANKLPAAEAVLMPGPSELPSADSAGQAVDYKKLIDLDASDVVANADGFDCPVCMMAVPAGVGVTLRECLHNFCRLVNG